MTATFDRLDWSLLQSFLAVAEGGSLSAAARALHASQPTVGRHISALEEALEAPLFLRQARGMALTDAGAALLDHVQAMKRAADAARLAALGEAGTETGTVRITASVFTAHHVLPGIVAELRAAHPAISLDIVANDETENLLFREADIAVRMYRPRQLDMVALHLGDIRIGLFAAPSYIARRGRPRRETFLDHDFVGYDRNEEIIRGFRAQGMNVDRDFFTVRTDNQTVYWELVRAGAGLGFGQRRAGQTEPDLEEIPLDFQIPPLEVWLTAHERVRRVPRVALVWDHLARRLGAYCDADPGVA